MGVQKEFWSGLLNRVRQRPDVKVHELHKSFVPNDKHFIDTYYNNHCFRYNIYLRHPIGDDDASPGVSIGSKGITCSHSTKDNIPTKARIIHDYGNLRQMGREHWPEVQDRMIDEILRLAQEQKLL